MGNLTAIATHTRSGQEVLCEAGSHVLDYELASMAVVAGVVPRTIPGENGVLRWEQLERAIRPKTYYVAQTGLICLENTHNMAGGTVYPQPVADEICDRAHEAGLPVHLDGARVFNAAAALGRPVAEITRGFDSVMFCLSKGLGAPIGSMLVGSDEFIERARTVRKRLGGGMRQVGVIAAAGLVALEEGPELLKIDHEHARMLARSLAGKPGIEIDPEKVQTNIVIFDIAGTGKAMPEILDSLRAGGVLALPAGPTRVRFVTHRDLAREDIDRAIEAVDRVFGQG
jgi:threonine aldolase